MTKNKIPLMTGKRRGKRVMQCAETLQETGQNPFLNLIRLAGIAEKNGDIPTASANWRYLGDFIDAKRKAIDPAEIKDLQQRAITLEELQKMKLAIIAGAGVPIPEDTVIENQLPIIELNQSDSADDLV